MREEKKKNFNDRKSYKNSLHWLRCVKINSIKHSRRHKFQ